jgi:transposase-like protein
MGQPHTDPEPSLIAIERPRCPKCDARMMLARRQPGPTARSELRTFECPKCHRTLQVLAGDPIQSDAAGWTKSDLVPPR